MRFVGVQFHSLFGFPCIVCVATVKREAEEVVDQKNAKKQKKELVEEKKIEIRTKKKIVKKKAETSSDEETSSESEKELKV